MNHRISDNKVQTMQEYLRTGLRDLYDERETANIIAELFKQFKSWNRAEMVINQGNHLSESEILKFHFALKKLIVGEPLQYVLGKSWFCGIELEVNSSVLIPRPETEELVNLILKENKKNIPKIIDLGTGSGCIAVALKKNIADAIVYAVDISKEALTCAKKNAIAQHTDIHFLQKDILHEELGDLKFDIIVSNPPYIPHEEEQEMRPQVVNFEPHVALFVPNNNALVFYKRIIELAKKHLLPNGKIYVEIHERLKPLLEEELYKNSISEYNFIQDMQGKTRMLTFSL